MRQLLLIGAFLLDSTATAQVQKWEYAKLEYISGLNRQLSVVRWFSGGELTYGGSDFVQIYNLFKANNEYLPEIKRNFDPSSSAAVLNAIGSQGWELVSYFSNNHFKDTFAQEWFFKRPIK